MTLRILIIDDEPLALDRLRVALRAIPEVTVVGEARTGAEALQKIQTSQPDVVILDVQMPGGNGIEVAKTLQGQQGAPEFVFATAFDDYAAAAFELDASDYLLKPIRMDRLHAAVTRAQRRLDARLAGERIAELELIVQNLDRSDPNLSPTSQYDAEIWAPRPGGVSRVPIDNVIWIEAARDYILVHTTHKCFILRETMNNVGARLDPARMLRVHRSAFVNRSNVQSIQRQGRDAITLKLSNGSTVRVGDTYREAVLSALRTSIPNRRMQDY